MKDPEDRFTELELTRVARVVHKILLELDPHERVDQAREVLVFALANHVPDTSCVTCDFYRGGYCLTWKADVPGGHIETGCDQRQEHGVPF